MEAKLLVLIVTSSRLFPSIPAAQTAFPYIRNMYSIGREDSQHPRLRDFPFSSKPPSTAVSLRSLHSPPEILRKEVRRYSFSPERVTFRSLFPIFALSSALQALSRFLEKEGEVPVREKDSHAFFTSASRELT